MTYQIREHRFGAHLENGKRFDVELPWRTVESLATARQTVADMTRKSLADWAAGLQGDETAPRAYYVD